MVTTQVAAITLLRKEQEEEQEQGQGGHHRTLPTERKVVNTPLIEAEVGVGLEVGAVNFPLGELRSGQQRKLKQSGYYVEKNKSD